MASEEDKGWCPQWPCGYQGWGGRFHPGPLHPLQPTDVNGLREQAMWQLSDLEERLWQITYCLDSLSTVLPQDFLPPGRHLVTRGRRALSLALDLIHHKKCLEEL